MIPAAMAAPLTSADSAASVAPSTAGARHCCSIAAKVVTPLLARRAACADKLSVNVYYMTLLINIIDYLQPQYGQSGPLGVRHDQT